MTHEDRLASFRALVNRGVAAIETTGDRIKSATFRREFDDLLSLWSNADLRVRKLRGRIDELEQEAKDTAQAHSKALAAKGDEIAKLKAELEFAAVPQPKPKAKRKTAKKA